MKTISTQAFKHTLRDIHQKSLDRKFCFLLGAGASFKSGIPTGADLAKEWFKEISERYKANEIEEWIKDVNLNKKNWRLIMVLFTENVLKLIKPLATSF